MGIFDAIFGEPVDFNSRKLSCSQSFCSRSHADKHTREGTLWICVNCLDAYCTEHINNLTFYRPHFGVSDFVSSETRSGLADARAKARELEEEGIHRWIDKMQDRGIDPADWGVPSILNDWGQKEGYILCSDCVKKVEDLSSADEFLEMEEVYGDYPNDKIKPNIFVSKNLDDERFKDRFEKRYG